MKYLIIIMCLLVLSDAEVVATDKQYALEITGTTG